MLFVLGFGLVFSRHPLTLRRPGGQLIRIARRGKKVMLVCSMLVAIGLIGYLILWGSYRFRYEAGGPSRSSFRPFWSQFMPKQPLVKQTITWAKEWKALPEAYLFGLSHVIKASRRKAFLMGEVSKGWWHYFLVTFAVKTPLPLLILLTWLLFLLPKLWRDHPLYVNFLMVPVVIYFGVALASRINIGHRHLLPIYPFLFVLTSALIPWSKTKKPVVKVFLAVLAVWYVVSSATIFPHYLAYFNELAGGPENGHKYLVDSNLDWGQDLKGLKRYMEKRGIERVWLSYFGTASPDHYGIAYNYLPSYVIFNPPKDRIPTPYMAISATNLQGIYLPAAGVEQDYFL
jgi:hypothetical protein